MAYISAANVKMIRESLKKEYPEIKFSVKGLHHTKVQVSILKSKIDFSEILENREYSQINEYRLDDYGQNSQFLKNIVNIIKNASDRKYYDDSDISRDYFDCAFYFNLSVGSYEKPYQLIS